MVSSGKSLSKKETRPSDSKSAQFVHYECLGFGLRRDLIMGDDEIFMMDLISSDLSVT